MTDYKSMFEQAANALAAIDEALGIGDDGCCDPDQTLDAIACLKASPISEEAMDILRAENDKLKAELKATQARLVASDGLGVAAKARFYELGGDEEPDPLERLRFFCSLAMDGQDWIDVEPFFDDVQTLLTPNAEITGG